MTPEDFAELKGYVISNAKSIQALSARSTSQQGQLDDVLTALDLIGRARSFQEERIELDRNIKALLTEILTEVRQQND